MNLYNYHLVISTHMYKRPVYFSRRSKTMKQHYRYHKIRRAFGKFNRWHFGIVSKYNVGLKTLLLQGLSEPEFYGDLVYEFKK